MKRWIGCVLVLCLLFSLTLVGCSKTPEITDLLPAAEKLTASSSYRLRIIMSESNRVPNKEVTLEYLVEKAEDGTSAIYHRYNDDTVLNGDTSYYYEGVNRYEWHEYITPVEVTVSAQDTPFTMADVLRQRERLVVEYGEQGVLALFDGMNPTRTKEEDGRLLLEVKDMSVAQFEKLYAAMNTEGVPPTYANGRTLTAGTVSGRIDADGYLREVAFSYTTTYESKEEQLELRFVIDQINSTTVKKPDFAKELPGK